MERRSWRLILLCALVVLVVGGGLFALYAVTLTD